MASQKTIALLADYIGADVEDADVSNNMVDFGWAEFLVFPSYDAAERYAKQYLKDSMEMDPEAYGEFLKDYTMMRPLDIQLVAQDMSNHVYDYDDDEALEYAGMDEDDDADEAREKLYDQSVDDIEKQLNEDAAGYLEELGYTVKAAVDKGLLVFDEERAANDLIRYDGLGHTLASYDHEEIELDGGAHAYRIN